jgi:hypothetical protein
VFALYPLVISLYGLSHSIMLIEAFAAAILDVHLLETPCAVDDRLSLLQSNLEATDFAFQTSHMTYSSNGNAPKLGRAALGLIKLEGRLVDRPRLTVLVSGLSRGGSTIMKHGCDEEDPEAKLTCGDSGRIAARKNVVHMLTLPATS